MDMRKRSHRPTAGPVSRKTREAVICLSQAVGLMSDNGARFFPSRLPWLVWSAGVYNCWVSKVALVTNTATSDFSNILLHSGEIVADLSQPLCSIRGSAPQHREKGGVIPITTLNVAAVVINNGAPFGLLWSIGVITNFVLFVICFPYTHMHESMHVCLRAHKG